MPTEQHTLVLLHEQNLVRMGLARLLAELEGFQLLTQAADVPALKRALALAPDPALLLLSAETATADHCGLVLWLREQCPNTYLLLLGNNTPATTLFTAFCAGAHGYLCTNHAHERMVAILHQLVDGAIHFPAEVLAFLRPWRASLEPEMVDDGKPISLCQQEFLRWLLVPEELTYAGIAQRTGKSERSIKKYSTDLRKRFKVNSKGGLIKVAMRRGLDKLGPPVRVG